MKILQNSAGQRQPCDGRPFYCQTCGCGWAEYMACDRADCQLESEERAKARTSEAA